MNTAQALQYINAQALTPDQLLPYVSAVSGAQSELRGEYVIHRQGGHIIFVGYCLQNPENTENLNSALEQALKDEQVHELTVLAPIRPSIAPEHAISTQDNYWFVQIPPPKPRVKVRNMLARANKHIYIDTKSGQGAWSGAHQEMMLDYIRRKNLDANLCSIMQRLGTYIITSSQVKLFSAYEHGSDKLLACALGDFSSFSTSFYMFAFRHEQASPGVADAVLFALFDEANACGHNQCNLGLGISDGIRFFKQKWGATPTLPFVQTSWEIKKQKKSWFSRFLD